METEHRREIIGADPKEVSEVLREKMADTFKANLSSGFEAHALTVLSAVMQAFSKTVPAQLIEEGALGKEGDTDLMVAILGAMSSTKFRLEVLSILGYSGERATYSKETRG